MDGINTMTRTLLFGGVWPWEFKDSEFGKMLDFEVIKTEYSQHVSIEKNSFPV